MSRNQWQARIAVFSVVLVNVCRTLVDEVHLCSEQSCAVHASLCSKAVSGFI